MPSLVVNPEPKKLLKHS